MTDTAESGLRARRRRETTVAIHQAALDLFEERGFDAVTVPEIAARAGIATRTLFRYVDSKEGAALPAQRRLDEAITDYTPTARDLTGIAAEILTLMRDASVGSDDVTRDEHRRIARLFQTTPALHAVAAAREATLAQRLNARVSDALPDHAPVEVRMLIEATIAVWRTTWWQWGVDLSRDDDASPADSFEAARTAFLRVSGMLAPTR